jgi:hypothetical protein
MLCCGIMAVALTLRDGVFFTPICCRYIFGVIGRIERPCVGLFGDPELKVGGTHDIMSRYTQHAIMSSIAANPHAGSVPVCVVQMVNYVLSVAATQHVTSVCVTQKCFASSVLWWPMPHCRKWAAYALVHILRP